MLWEHQRDPSIGIDAKDRGEGVRGSAVVDPHLVTRMDDRLLATVEPDPGVQRIGRLGIRLVVGGLEPGCA
jgi:hypothetical protein